MMRKIKTCEIKTVSKCFAEIFRNYKAYDIFFRHNRFQKLKVYYFFCYEIYESVDYTYTNDDYTAICAIKTPDEKGENPNRLFKNFFFMLAFAIWTGRKARKLAIEYLNFSDEIQSKYFNPKTDCYVENIGVALSVRGHGLLKSMLDEVCKDKPIYLETHLVENVAMYKHLGFKICEEASFRGIIHYAMKKDGIKH